jgi:hypothetical protein
MELTRAGQIRPRTLHAGRGFLTSAVFYLLIIMYSKDDPLVAKTVDICKRKGSFKASRVEGSSEKKHWQRVQFFP